MMKNSIQAMEEKTNEAMQALLQMVIEEDEVNVTTMSAIGSMSELIDANFKVQYDLAEELEQIKDLIKYKN